MDEEKIADIEIVEEEPVKKKASLKDLWNEVKDIVLPVIVVFVLFKVILNLFWVPSGSMETTIPTKSLLVGWRLSYLVSDKAPERGDIITFHSAELNEVLVKRCIGIAGDQISYENGYVYVNGEKIDEPYLDVQGITDAATSFTVPEGCFFVMGDNRTGSYDARFWMNPYIEYDQIIAHVLLCVSVGNTHAWQGVHWLAN